MSISQIIILTILTILIFALTVFAFSSIYNPIKESVEAGNKDDELKEKIEKRKKNIIGNLVYDILSFVFLIVLIAVGTMSFVVQKNNDKISIKNDIALVVASNSMDGFYSEVYKLQLLEVKPDADKQQFAVGDICFFKEVSTEEELVPYDIYGYKTKDGKIIIHRYLQTNTDGKLVFRGDNTQSRDSFVNREQVLYHYTGTRIIYVGNFILFFRSIIGIVSIISIVIVYFLASLYFNKYNRVLKRRYKKITKEQEELEKLKAEEALSQAKKKQLPPGALAEFTRKNGKHVVIYPKGYKKSWAEQS